MKKANYGVNLDVFCLDAILTIDMCIVRCGYCWSIVGIDYSIRHSILYTFDTAVKRYILPWSKRALYIEMVYVLSFVLYCV